MKIITKSTVGLNTLDCGAVFEYEESYYMLVDSSHLDRIDSRSREYDLLAVDLTDGEVCWFDEETRVRSCPDAQLCV